MVGQSVVQDRASLQDEPHEKAAPRAWAWAGESTGPSMPLPARRMAAAATVDDDDDDDEILIFLLRLIMPILTYSVSP